MPYFRTISEDIPGNEVEIDIAVLGVAHDGAPFDLRPS
jgi:hypothetical protein